MVIRKVRNIAVLAIIMVAVSALVLAAILPGNANASSKYTIRANVNKDCTGTPYYVGQQIGYFEGNNINFVDQGALDYSLQPAALISGQDDLYDGHPNTIINLLQSGAKVKAVVMSGYEPADGNLSEQHMHWLTLANGPYQTLDDLFANGHKPKIAVLATGICADLETNAYFREHNITSDRYELITLSDPQQEAALRAGTIDVAVLHPPFYTAAEQHGGVTILTTSTEAFGKVAGTSLLVFTEAFIKNHPDAVRAYIKAYKDAERWSNDHRAEAGELTAKTIGLTSSTAHYYSYSGAITDADIQPWIDAMVTEGTIAAGQYKPSDLYTTEFSDLWVNETAPQPLNPFGKSTDFNSAWVNQTSAPAVLPFSLSEDLVGSNELIAHYGGANEAVRTVYLTARPR
jgi:ABC-type nitrate/sulfonate/bicarbonate transport system substrate-binding protein